MFVFSYISNSSRFYKVLKNVSCLSTCTNFRKYFDFTFAKNQRSVYNNVSLNSYTCAGKNYVTTLFQAIIAEVGSISEDSPWQSETSTIFENVEIKQYLQDCASIAWKMVIQKPPMYFKQLVEGEEWLDDDKSELMWGSDPNAPTACILYHKNPAMVFRDDILVKATVYVNAK